jgi:glycosyltransferase involved in cell wall biosynthesis
MQPSPMRIGILGTRGIPNHYGGFEQLAQYLSKGLVEKGHTVFVYNSHKHPYRLSEWNGVQMVHCYDPEYLIGMAGQFVYDLNCTLDARKRKLDILLVLGYTSSSVWGWLYPSATVCINHMDGMEWQRSKYGWLTKCFLRYAEKLAIRFSSYFIADSVVIQAYLKEQFHINSSFIAYGADIPATAQQANDGLLQMAGKKGFSLLIARIEKENNIEMILEGFHQSAVEENLLVVGNTANSFGRKLIKKYAKDHRIRFAGAIYEQEHTAWLKAQCRYYFHGHSVGGTNPSLLEAMAAGAFVCCHNNPFNKAILQENGFYFSSADDVRCILEKPVAVEWYQKFRNNNLEKIRHLYQWNHVIDQYEQFMLALHQQQKNETAILYKGYYR